MILQTKELFASQDILQQRILKEHNLTQEETMQRRYLALLVELGELANETRCFKYWSRKGPSESNCTVRIRGWDSFLIVPWFGSTNNS